MTDPRGLPADIAVLCSGPSLTKTWPPRDRGKYRYVFAVNEAGKLEHDVFCCQDSVAIEMFDPRPRFGYMGHFRLWKRTKGRAVIWPPLGFKHRNWTLPQVIAGCSLFHPQAIDIFGADWAGVGTFTGPGRKEDAPKRGPNRWEAEQAAVRQAMAQFGLAGRVRRQLPGAEVFVDSGSGTVG